MKEIDEKLFTAVSKIDAKGVIEALAEGANINATGYNSPGSSSEYSDLTPLHLAIRRQNVEIIKILLDAGADKEARTIRNLTPLHYLCNMVMTSVARSSLDDPKDIEILKLLLLAGVDREAKTDYGYTPLHVISQATRGGGVTVEGNKHSIEIFKILLDAGADKDAKTDYGRAPLHLAWEIEKTKMLLDAGADKEAKTKGGWTPLHSKAYWGEYKSVEILLKSGANALALDKDGNTPLDLILGEGENDWMKKTVSLLKSFVINKALVHLIIHPEHLEYHDHDADEFSACLRLVSEDDIRTEIYESWKKQYRKMSSPNPEEYDFNEVLNEHK